MGRVKDALNRNHPDGDGSGGALQCPWCKSFSSTAVERTNNKGKNVIRRVRVCLNCNKCFGTNEVVTQVIEKPPRKVKAKPQQAEDDDYDGDLDDNYDDED